MNRMSSGYALGLLLIFVGVGLADEAKVVKPDLSLVNDGKTFNVVNANAELTKKAGKPTIVNLKVKGGDIPGQSNIGLALVEGLEFSEGTIELDMKGFGRTQPCFLGIGLNVVDEKTFESVYFWAVHVLPRQYRSDSIRFLARQRLEEVANARLCGCRKPSPEGIRLVPCPLRSDRKTSQSVRR